jgi:hypothetical protein
MMVFPNRLAISVAAAPDVNVSNCNREWPLTHMLPSFPVTLVRTRLIPHLARFYSTRTCRAPGKLLQTEDTVLTDG